MGILSNLKLILSVGAIVVLVGIIGGVGLMAERHGYRSGYAAAEATYTRQMAAQAEANRKAIAEADAALMRTADQLSVKSLELDHALSTIDQAAGGGAEPDAIGLDAQRMRDLGAIR